VRTGCWREDRVDFDGVWEQVAGERRGQIMSEFRKKFAGVR